MKKLLLVATAALALSGCATASSQTQGTNLYTFTQTDLANAIKIDTAAAASTDPNVSNPAKVKLACDTWVSQNLALLQGQTAAAPVTGVFSATSAADVVANNALEALGPAGQASFELGCGPEAMHVLGLVTGFKALGLVAPTAVQAIR